MIELTRLSGSTFVLNADLIERVESSPDTVIWLVDGKKFLVTESVAEVVAAVLQARSALIAAGARMTEEAQQPVRRTLAPVADISSAHHDGGRS